MNGLAQLPLLARALGQHAAASQSSVIGGAFWTSRQPFRQFATPTDQETIDFGFKQVPKEEKASLVADVFSKVASSYDVMNDLMTGGMHRMWKDHMVSALRPFPGMTHLDVAGGTGDIAFRVLRAIRAAEASHAAEFAANTATNSSHSGAAAGAVPWGNAGGGSGSTSFPTQGLGGASPVLPMNSMASGRGMAGSSKSEPGAVYVCDINPAMLAEGRRKAAMMPDLAGDHGLVFELGNAEALTQFPDNMFDAYTIAFGIRNVTDRPAALREAYRVLKPGGRFLCMEFSQVSHPVLRQAYDMYSFNFIPRLGELVAGDHASYQYLVESIRQFPDQATWSGMIEDAGFRKVGYENIIGGVVALHSGYKV